MAIVLAGIAVLALLAWLFPTRAAPDTPLDPDNPGLNGTRAVATVLGREGVAVSRVRDRAALAVAPTGPGSTVVVTRSELLAGDGMRVLRDTRADRIVLVEPTSSALEALGLEVDVRPSPGDGGVVAANCSWANAAGLSITSTGSRYGVFAPSDATTCFAPGDGYGAGGDDAGQVVRIPRAGDRPEVVLLGNPEVLRNKTIVDADHAALALRVLGSTPRLVWWNVDPRDSDAEAAAEPVVPSWFLPAVAILAMTTLVWMLVRGRRLGALVTEPLPVLVRADETTRARGRLYERAADTTRAAALLRRGTRHRLSSYLSAPDRPPDLVTAAASSSGREQQQVERLLFGPPPATDRELTHLARELRALEREVRPG